MYFAIPDNLANANANSDIDLSYLSQLICHILNVIMP